MKKFLYSLFMMIPLVGFMSCSNDENDLPNVDFSYQYENAQEKDGTLYVVEGETFEITGLSVTNNEPGKGAGITAANYFWDGMFVGPALMPEFSCTFDTQGMAVGTHMIGIRCTVIAVDKEIANAAISIPVQIVASPEDLPVPPTDDDNGSTDDTENPSVPVESTITSGTNK